MTVGEREKESLARLSNCALKERTERRDANFYSTVSNQISTALSPKQCPSSHDSGNYSQFQFNLHSFDHKPSYIVVSLSVASSPKPRGEDTEDAHPRCLPTEAPQRSPAAICCRRRGFFSDTWTDLPLPSPTGVETRIGSPSEVSDRHENFSSRAVRLPLSPCFSYLYKAGKHWVRLLAHNDP